MSVPAGNAAKDIVCFAAPTGGDGADIVSLSGENIFFATAAFSPDFRHSHILLVFEWS